jgi:hypothetical protein
MIFSLYDFCKIAWFKNPLKIGNKSPTILAVDPAGQKS